MRELERERRRRLGEREGGVGGDATSESRGGVGRAATPRAPFAPSDLLAPVAVAVVSAPRVGEFERVRARHADLDDALAESARVGDLLLKREAAERARVSEYAEELDRLERDPFAGAREAPCAGAAASVRACYGANAGDVTACRELVDEYKKCGRVALRKFVAREPASA